MGDQLALFLFSLEGLQPQGRVSGRMGTPQLPGRFDAGTNQRTRGGGLAPPSYRRTVTRSRSLAFPPQRDYFTQSSYLLLDDVEHKHYYSVGPRATTKTTSG